MDYTKNYDQFIANRRYQVATLLAMLCFALPASAQWKYSSEKVGIDEVSFKFAELISTESLNLAFPYAGKNFPRIIVRTNPKGWDFIFSIPQGQLSCYQSCQVKIKVDEKPSRMISMVRAADSGVRNLIFVQNSSQAQSLARELASASKIAVELPIYKAMGTIVRFDVTGLNLEELGVKVTPSTYNAPAKDKLILDLQTALNQKGFNAGPADGYMGQQTRTAIISAQKSLGLIVNGLPSDALLADLLKLPKGISVDSAHQNQSDASRNYDYSARVRACVQSGITFPTPVRSNLNPTAHYKVDLRSDGTIASIKLIRSSGNYSFDRSVDTGIRRCSPFARPASGKYPSYIDINYHMYD